MAHHRQPEWRPLALGRSQRLASKGQTMALIARDAGCSFPGCTHSASWCERHHIVDWISGGLTDLDNLTPLCRYHHTHFLQKGWTGRINADGLPEWRPPRWIDRAQRPQINARIRTHQHPTPARTSRPTATNTRSGVTSFHQLAPSRSLSSLVNSETSGSAVPFTAVIGTAPLRLLVQKAPRDSRRSWTEQRRITTGVR
jgi:hypothetical protein